MEVLGQVPEQKGELAKILAVATFSPGGTQIPTMLPERARLAGMALFILCVVDADADATIPVVTL